MPTRRKPWRPDDDGPPTLDQIRRWPAAVNVSAAALALDISRAAMYKAIAEDRAPVAVITVGHRMKVLTSSLVAVLEGRGSRAAGGAA
jgi:hypothetical protein